MSLVTKTRRHMLLLRILAACTMLAASCGDPLYLVFQYKGGVEYDITSNETMIKVASAHDTPIYFYIPPECDAILRATKSPPYIVIELPCHDDVKIPSALI